MWYPGLMQNASTRSALLSIRVMISASCSRLPAAFPLRMLICPFISLVLPLPPLQAQEQAEPVLTPLQQGRELFEKRRFAEAEQVLREFISANTGHQDTAAASVLHGRALMRLNRPDDARRSFDWTLSRHPRSAAAPAALEGLIEFHEHRRNATAAQEARQRLLSEHPDSPVTARVWLPLANAAFEKGDFAQAVAIFAKLESGLDVGAKQRLEAARILVAGGRDPDSLLDVATASLFANNTGTARLLLEHFVATHPQHSRIHEARTRLGWAIYQGGDQEAQDRAEQLWTGVARAEPKGEWGGKSRWHLAQLHAGPKHEWEAAITLLEGIVNDFPVGSQRHEQALYTRAWLFWAQRQWPQAVEAFEDLIQAYPEKSHHPAITRYIEQATAMANR